MIQENLQIEGREEITIKKKKENENLKYDLTLKKQTRVLESLNLSKQAISSRRQSPEEIIGNCRHLASESRMSEEI